MDLSTFVTYDKKETLLLSIAKPNQEIVEKTHSKPQETLEFKMTKQKVSFSFDVPLNLEENGWWEYQVKKSIKQFIISLTATTN